MGDTSNTQGYGRKRGNAWVGIIILCAGILMLLRRMGMLVPGWIFSWPFLLVVIGFAVGLKRNFRSVSPFILIVVGLFFLARRIGWLPDDMDRYIWPAIIIVIGIFIMVKPRGGRWQFSGEGQNSNDDTLSSVIVFWGTKRNVTSKNFKHGEVVNIFGGTELNFMNADINGTAVIDVVSAFGGVKIIVPSDWEVHVNAVHIFGGTDDKRPPVVSPNNKKVLMITGVVLFGGMDIQSYR